MATLSQLSNAALTKISAEITEIDPFYDKELKNFTTGDFAIVRAKITNTTGFPLKNIYVDTIIWGSNIKYQPMFKWDGNGGFCGDLEPLETWTSYVSVIKAISKGTSSIFLRISAEIMPYSTIAPDHTYVSVN